MVYLVSHKTALLLLLFLAAGAVPVYSQGGRLEQQQELRRLRAEIARYRDEISQREAREGSLLDMLANLEKEIDVTRGLLTSLQNDEEEKKRRITRIEEDLAYTERELTRVKQSFAKRLVNFYKYGRTKDLELLLTARSLNQAKIWLHFEKVIADNDRRKIENIVKKKRHIQNQRVLLNAEVASKEKIVRDTIEETKNLESSITERKKVLEQVQGDRALLERRLRESEEALRRIENYIDRAEEERRTEAVSEAIQLEKNFPSLKGKMIWPIKGTVVSEFGDQKHPLHGTVTANFGIDIKAAEGTPVYCVAQGIVSVITWQPLFGNFVMIQHGGGYYTVYSHLSMIEVSEREVVDRGTAIGSVGDSGSLSGPILNFQVWKGRQQMNPITWLER